MVHFFSRRAYDQTKKTFTSNPSKLTRYARNDVTPGGTQGSLLDRDAWLAEVLATAETPDILIHVHGFNTEHEEMLARHRLVAGRLAGQGYRGAIVSFDWPSNGSLLAYPADRSNAKTVAPFFVSDGIFEIRKAAPDHRIHVLAHSMGAFVTLRGFSEHGGNWRVDEVLFVAGDVESAFLKNGAWGGLVMARHCGRLTNYFNIHDEVLDLPKLIFMGGQRAGRVGLPDQVASNHEDLYCARQFETKVADKQGFNSHRWYFEDEGFYQDAALTLAGTAPVAMPTRKPATDGGLALLT